MEAFVKIAILENEIEAYSLGSILEELEIPHRFRSYHDTAFDGLFQSQKGWGYVAAPRVFEEEILEILADLREGARP
ncbi:MAG: hypothetical protein JRF59_01235 [Deltaproteobacteria bacterium]|nr:hypothetical protein [Deltaproteobacteria bacterium]MBW1922326.1 hypothetical protein [Deltaproteobacteria bacterium]MBW1948078.1 hypothetical protein [Deltaproteobacteria bacterium]MBW2006503.1 hypothetical protein [Deltaproteobacteria bacterium]MBW2101878.1 hypothetical protein [Deltaproteobacteria bacterium]